MPSNDDSETEPDPDAALETDGSAAETAETRETEGTEEATETEETDDESAEPRSVTDVETIVLDPDDVLQAIAYNGQEDIGQKRKTVFSLSAPFEETVEPSLVHLGEDSRAETDDDEIHIRPFRFVAKGRQVIERRPTRELAKEELDVEEPDDATIEAWIDEAMDEWKSHVRSNLVDTVDIYSNHGMAFVDVEFREEE